MRVFITILIISFFVFTYSNDEKKTGVENRILQIENNLNPFKSLELSFQPATNKLKNPKTITERMKFYKTPGVSIATINDFKIEWSKGYGKIDANTGSPVTTKTIFEAASTSKFITAALSLYFVQKGLIDLDENVNNYLKSWKIPENEFTKVEKVTLRRLLTHKSGLPTTNYSFDEKVGYPTLFDVLNGKSPALNKPATPELIPGTKWQYSNIAYNVIQLLIEDISGKPFQKNAEEIIFKPLKMTNSTFVYPLDPEKKTHEAMPHDAEGIKRKPSMHLTAVAHGGLTTTPTDLAKFTLEMMNSFRGKSEKILSQEMTKKLFNKEFDLDPKMFGLPLSEGLGVFLKGEGKNLIFFHPGGNLPGLNCWLIGWPNRGTGAVIMTNSAKGEILAIEVISSINREYSKTVN